MNFGIAHNLPGISLDEWLRIRSEIDRIYRAGEDNAGQRQWEMLISVIPDMESRRDDKQSNMYWITVDINCSRCGERKEVFALLHDGEHKIDKDSLRFYTHKCHVQPHGRDRDDNRDENLWNRGR